MTDPIGSSKIGRTLVNFVSNQALETRSGQATGIKALAYDTGLPDLNLLLDGVDSSFSLIPIRPDQDAIEQIGRGIAGNACRELAILCHGSSGSLNIGSNSINTEILVNRQKELTAWNIQTVSLYSCNAGSDLNFIQTLSNIMGSQVFASTSKVGAVAQGGRDG